MTSADIKKNIISCFEKLYFVLPSDDITFNSNWENILLWENLKMDDIDIINLTLELEKRFNIAIFDYEVDSFITLENIYKLIISKKQIIY